eukprot:4933279-Prymnesium_polylepis.1
MIHSWAMASAPFTAPCGTAGALLSPRQEPRAEEPTDLASERRSAMLRARARASGCFVCRAEPSACRWTDQIVVTRPRSQVGGCSRRSSRSSPTRVIKAIARIPGCRPRRPSLTTQCHRDMDESLANLP